MRNNGESNKSDAEIREEKEEQNKKYNITTALLCCIGFFIVVAGCLFLLVDRRSIFLFLTGAAHPDTSPNVNIGKGAEKVLDDALTAVFHVETGKTTYVREYS